MIHVVNSRVNKIWFDLIWGACTVNNVCDAYVREIGGAAFLETRKRLFKKLLQLVSQQCCVATWSMLHVFLSRIKFPCCMLHVAVTYCKLNAFFMPASVVSKHISFFLLILQVDKWERTLSLILEITEMILTVQRQWMYLEVTVINFCN